MIANEKHSKALVNLVQEIGMSEVLNILAAHCAHRHEWFYANGSPNAAIWHRTGEALSEAADEVAI
jgi:hypothetical protein